MPVIIPAKTTTGMVCRIIDNVKKKHLHNMQDNGRNGGSGEPLFGYYPNANNKRKGGETKAAHECAGHRRNPAANGGKNNAKVHGAFGK